MTNTLHNIKAIAAGVLFLFIAYITATGQLMEYVPFADPLNEMAFFALSILMGIGSLFCIKL